MKKITKKTDIIILVLNIVITVLVSLLFWFDSFNTNIVIPFYLSLGVVTLCLFYKKKSNIIILVFGLFLILIYVIEAIFNGFIENYLFYIFI